MRDIHRRALYSTQVQTREGDRGWYVYMYIHEGYTSKSTVQYTGTNEGGGQGVVRIHVHFVYTGGIYIEEHYKVHGVIHCLVM